MPTHRLIDKAAGTGERISSLSHLGFRVWMQYELSADDFGVCPAEAFKLQGENVALQKETPEAVQAEIENLISIGLCGVFQDGARRYLFQFDWQDWQKIKHPSKTSLPPVDAESLLRCSRITQALFAQHHPKVNGTFSPHANAIANASAIASADADARFERWWDAYPRKVGKGNARAIWRRLDPSEELTAEMIRATDEQKRSSQWRKQGGQFVPHPSTWLNQGRWQDAPDHHRGESGFSGMEEAIRG